MCKVKQQRDSQESGPWAAVPITFVTCIGEKLETTLNCFTQRVRVSLWYERSIFVDLGRK